MVQSLYYIEQVRHYNLNFLREFCSIWAFTTSCLKVFGEWAPWSYWRFLRWEKLQFPCICLEDRGRVDNWSSVLRLENLCLSAQRSCLLSLGHPTPIFLLACILDECGWLLFARFSDLLLWIISISDGVQRYGEAIESFFLDFTYKVFNFIACFVKFCW